MKLSSNFTSDTTKFWNHPEALEGLRTDKPKPVVSHIMLTDRCNHRCAFCSVQSRDGDTLTPEVVTGYLDQLVPLGLKSIILSGGGNPVLWRSNGMDFNDIVGVIKGYGLEIGLITNGLPMTVYGKRQSWKGIKPETLDKCTWIRISMAGLDHDEKMVAVPDIDPTKTTLGFSYVYHDVYFTPDEPHHHKVSTPEDAQAWKVENVWRAEDRIEELTQQIRELVEKHHPKYVRLLPNCLEPPMIKDRCAQLQKIADAIDPSVCFVQYKPPAAPDACYLGYLHPVLNCDGFCYPCDSCVLNQTAHHKFAVPWRMCRWDEIGDLYKQPVHSLIKDTHALCSGCVFSNSNRLLIDIKNGLPLQSPMPATHPNFI